MKNVIITQVKNQEDRIYEWMDYHHKEGFETFIIFDDFSEDETINEILKFSKNFTTSNVLINKTDGIGGTYSISDCKNSESRCNLCNNIC